MNAKIIIIFLSLIIAFLIIYILFCHNTFYVDAPIKNMGRMLPSENNENIQFSENFEISNYGFSTITIHRITVSCGCTKVDYPSEIKPFSSIKLLVNVEYPASILEGKSVDIVIESSAKDSPKILKLISEVGNYYSCSTSSMNLGTFYKSKENSSQISINVSTFENHTPEILFINHPKNLTYKIRETDERFVKFTDGTISRFSTFYVGVSPNDKCDVGKFMESLDILIRGEKDYNISIPVSWEILPEASFMLNSYYFSKNQNTVAIILNYDASIKKIKDISLSNNDFKIISKKGFNNGLELLVKYEGNLSSEANSLLTVSFEDGKDSVSTSLNYILK